MENKKDLRVIKTKRAIQQAFERLLMTRPLSKITVTELAKEAEINKGTFYLHYTDIYDLYTQSLSEHLQMLADRVDFISLLFTDKSAFVSKLIDLSDNRPFFQNDPYLTQANLQYNQMAMQIFCEKIADKALQTGYIEATDENKMKLIFLFSGLGTLFRTYPDSEHRGLAADIFLTASSSFEKSDQ
jgi:AcrR family transcriptional regulator